MSKSASERSTYLGIVWACLSSVAVGGCSSAGASDDHSAAAGSVLGVAGSASSPAGGFSTASDGPSASATNSAGGASASATNSAGGAVAASQGAGSPFAGGEAGASAAGGYPAWQQIGGFGLAGSSSQGGGSHFGAGGAPASAGATQVSAGGAPANGGAPSTSTGPVLPSHQQTCAPFVAGKMSILGVQASVWVGTPTAAQSGPVIIYWHATGTSGQEATSALGSAAIAEIVSQGGIVVAPETSTKQGTNTGDAVWYTGDFALADEVVSCALQQLHIDPTQIHALGYSAGGLQTAWMASARSQYLASVVSYSGGTIGNNVALQDPNHVPPALCAHGAAGNDVFILDFAQASKTYEQQIRKRGGFAIDCDDGGSHIDIAKRFKVAPSAWQFLKSHPFGVKPEPYASGLPAGFPSYCSVVP